VLEYCISIKILIVGVGASSTIFGAMSASTQTDLKSTIAYSTCSQLGYMILISGVSGYSIALFHLLNHGFFKALLFLCAGLIIFAISHEQDIRKFGTLVVFLPFIYSCFFISLLALIGFPFLSGFYSKELIIELAYS